MSGVLLFKTLNQCLINWPVCQSDDNIWCGSDDGSVFKRWVIITLIYLTFTLCHILCLWCDRRPLKKNMMQHQHYDGLFCLNNLMMEPDVNSEISLSCIRSAVVVITICWGSKQYVDFWEVRRKLQSRNLPPLWPNDSEKLVGSCKENKYFRICLI